MRKRNAVSEKRLNIRAGTGTESLCMGNKGGMIMNKRIVFLLAVLLAGALSLPRSVAAGAGMTLSSANKCVNSGEEINCANKVLVNFGVSYGLRALLDVAYLDTAGQGGGESQPLEETLGFEITKTKPEYVYSLSYLHTVAYAPHEELRKTRNRWVGIQSCIDGEDATTPTCGWTLENGGKKIPDSQGFCSNRDLAQLMSHGGDQSWWRGEKELGKRSTLLNSFSIGHCLRMGDVFFRGYEIDPPRRSYAITTDIFKGTTLLNTITLSPDYPIFLLKGATNGGHDVLARLLGEDKPSIAPPDLSNYILYVPSSPVDHPLVVDYQNNMLLVPREMVTIDGSECNKVGVGFKTFRAQAAVAAKSEAGDCFANQLYQLHASDLSLLTQDPNAETKYLVTGKKMFKSSLSFDRSLALVAKSPELTYSTVSLDLDAAQVGSIMNEAIGYIKEAYVKTFTSMSKNGTLVAVIVNAGRIKTDYAVTVKGCQPNIVGPIPVQARTVSPGEEVEIEFDIAASSNQDASHKCIVTLTASSGRIFDSCDVLFDTIAHGDKYPRELQLKNEDTVP